MKILITLSGYILAASIFLYGHFSQTSSASSTTASIPVIETLSIAQSSSQTEEPFADKQISLEKLEESDRTYEELLAEARQQVLDEVKNWEKTITTISLDSGLDREDVIQRTRKNLQDTVGIFLKELHIDNETYNTIIEELLINTEKRRGFNGKRALYAISEQRYQQELSRLEPKKVLSRYLSDPQLDQYDSYAEKEDIDKRRKEVASKIDRTTYGLAESTKTLLIDKFSDIYLSKKSGNTIQELDRHYQNMIDRIDNLESELRSRLSKSEMAKALPLIEYERVWAEISQMHLSR